MIDDMPKFPVASQQVASLKITNLTELPPALHQPIKVKENVGQASVRRAAIATTKEQGWPGTIGVLVGECLALIITHPIGEYMVT